MTCRVDDVLDRLNNYAGDDIWQDIIMVTPGYDPVATEALYQGLRRALNVDVAVIGGVIYRWIRGDRWRVLPQIITADMRQE